MFKRHPTKSKTVIEVTIAIQNRSRGMMGGMIKNYYRSLSTMIGREVQNKRRT
jgi:hypothetical protein